jgi:hypothetical protein
MLLLSGLLGGAASAQTASRPVTAEPFRIADNSFLVEEAFNQPPGVFQNIFGAIRNNGTWAAAFTQEWPALSQTHQLSYTLAWTDPGSAGGFGDTLINYRYQALMEGPGQPAFSPRVSVVLPTGDRSEGRGAGSPGLQFNLPFSKQAGDVYWHWNAGLTWLPRAERADDDTERLVSPFISASGIVRVRPMFHLMLESVMVSEHSVADQGTSRDTLFTVSPGFRTGRNLGDHQLIVGLAAPITWGGGTTDTAGFVYLSYELPFKR